MQMGKCEAVSEIGFHLHWFIFAYCFGLRVLFKNPKLWNTCMLWYAGIPQVLVGWTSGIYSFGCNNYNINRRDSVTVPSMQDKALWCIEEIICEHDSESPPSSLSQAHWKWTEAKWRAVRSLKPKQSQEYWTAKILHQIRKGHYSFIFNFTLKPS